MIPFWQGITAYVYLIAKMHYTQKQDLRPEDQDVKFNYQVKIILLVKAGRITELGYQYLLGVFHALQSLSANLNFEQLVDYVVKLPRIEQWLKDLTIPPLKRVAVLDYLKKQQPDCAKISKNQSSNANIVNKFQSQFFYIPDKETGELSSAAANYYGEALKYN